MMKKYVHYAFVGILAMLGFSCKTSQKALDKDKQKTIIQPDEPIKLMYGVPTVIYEEKTIDVKEQQPE